MSLSRDVIMGRPCSVSGVRRGGDTHCVCHRQCPGPVTAPSTRYCDIFYPKAIAAGTFLGPRQLETSHVISREHISVRCPAEPR